MKYPNKYVLAAILSLGSLAGSLMADTFDFSYALSNGGTFNGTLTGTQVGDSLTGYVTGFSVDSLFVNGTQASGTIFNTSFILPNGFPTSGGSGTAVVSFDRDQNNFLFVNSDYGNGIIAYDMFAYLINGSGHNAAYQYINVPFLSHGDDGDGVWTLTNTSSVPEGGATVGLLGLALIGFAGVRRQLAVR